MTDSHFAADGADPSLSPALELRGVSKSFGPVQAVVDADLELRQGEILALVGDNGAGKSTLMKIAAGTVRPDKGAIFVDGHQITLTGPHDARRYGIEMIYQDLALFDQLDVAGNIFVGRELSMTGGVLRKQAMWQRASELLDQLNIGIPSPKLTVQRMSGGQRQMVAVARALAFGSRILIMDEPTAALGVRESTAVLDTIRRLKGDHAIILITQRLPDVLELADRVTVLKGGRVQGVLDVEGTTLDDIANLIIKGRDELSAA